MKIKNKIRTALCKFLIPDIYKLISDIHKLIQEIIEIQNSEIWDYDFDNYITYNDLEEKERDINYDISQQIGEAKQEALDEISDIEDNLQRDIDNLTEDVDDLKTEKSQLLACIFKLAEKVDCEEEIHKILGGGI